MQLREVTHRSTVVLGLQLPALGLVWISTKTALVLGLVWIGSGAALVLGLVWISSKTALFLGLQLPALVWSGLALVLLWSWVYSYQLCPGSGLD